MESAKAMFDVTAEHLHNAAVDEINKLVTEAAHNGKFFIKLWEGKATTVNTQFIFVQRYNIEAYNFLQRMGYTFVSMQDPEGITRLYIGWGFNDDQHMKTVLKVCEER